MTIDRRRRRISAPHAGRAAPGTSPDRPARCESGERSGHRHRVIRPLRRANRQGGPVPQPQACRLDFARRLHLPVRALAETLGWGTPARCRAARRWRCPAIGAGRLPDARSADGGLPRAGLHDGSCRHGLAFRRRPMSPSTGGPLSVDWAASGAEDPDAGRGEGPLAPIANERGANETSHAYCA